MYLCRLKCPKEHHKVMKKEKRDNYTFLTHAPVHHVIFTMAIPTIISMLSTSMYNLADTYFVGSINTQSVAAVGVSRIRGQRHAGGLSPESDAIEKSERTLLYIPLGVGFGYQRFL